MSAPVEDQWRMCCIASALALTASTLVAAGLVQAEVVDNQAPGPSEAGVAIHETPVRLECWQNGRRIIEKDDIGGLAVKAATRKGAVIFKQIDGEGPDIFLLPFEDSLCLVAPED